jgi:predicted phage gp36 major capsid-like protein
VELDDLLRLPDSIDYSVESRGGATRDEWRRRFREAQRDLEEAKQTLRHSLDELKELGDQGNWKMSPPGLDQLKGQQSTQPGVTPGNQAPLDYRLSTQIRRNREEVKRAERALRDLEVEANLAGVPEQWRR